MKRAVSIFVLSFVAGMVGLAAGSIVTKPYTFTAGGVIRSAEVNSNFNTIYNDYNGNITDANISASAAIAQSKISGLATALQALVAKAGDTLSGALSIKMSVPYLRLLGQETSAKDWRFAETAGTLSFDENTGTEGAPTWTPRYTLPAGSGGPAAASDLATKTYVDNQVASLGFGQTTKTDADYTTTSSTFGDTGLQTTVTNLGTHRLRITLNAIIDNNSGNARTLAANIQVDGSDVLATDGVWTQTVNSNGTAPANLSVVTLGTFAAGAHTVKLQFKSSAGASASVRQSATSPAVLTVEELPR